jgi:hypothetical protein
VAREYKIVLAFGMFLYKKKMEINRNDYSKHLNHPKINFNQVGDDSTSGSKSSTNIET